jgi:uncharacterized membrane protein YqjE
MLLILLVLERPDPGWLSNPVVSGKISPVFSHLLLLLLLLLLLCDFLSVYHTFHLSYLVVILINYSAVFIGWRVKNCFPTSPLRAN